MEPNERDKDLMRRTLIAAPCSEKWEDMSGDDRARLCAKCDLHVVNTFMLTDEEVLAALEKVHKGERICMQIYRRQDGTFMTRNCPVGIQRIRERVFKAAVWMASGLSVLLSMAANALPTTPVNAPTKKKPGSWHGTVTQSAWDGTRTKSKSRAGLQKLGTPHRTLGVPYIPQLPAIAPPKRPELIVPSKPQTKTTDDTTGDASSSAATASSTKPRTSEDLLKSKGVVQVKPSSSAGSSNSQY